MAGRPRTMAKRVLQLLERQEALANELNELMPRQYRPADPVIWDLEATDAKGDVVTQLWRKAVFEIDGASVYLEDLYSILDLKAENAEKRAKTREGGHKLSLGADELEPGLTEPATEESPAPPETAVGVTDPGSTPDVPRKP